MRHKRGLDTSSYLTTNATQQQLRQRVAARVAGLQGLSRTNSSAFKVGVGR